MYRRVRESHCNFSSAQPTTHQQRTHGTMALDGSVGGGVPAIRATLERFGPAPGGKKILQWEREVRERPTDLSVLGCVFFGEGGFFIYFYLFITFYVSKGAYVSVPTLLPGRGGGRGRVYIIFEGSHNDVDSTRGFTAFCGGDGERIGAETLQGRAHLRTERVSVFLPKTFLPNASAGPHVCNFSHSTSQAKGTCHHHINDCRAGGAGGHGHGGVRGVPQRRHEAGVHARGSQRAVLLRARDGGALGAGRGPVQGRRQV
jgi:hypothetical protein